MKPAIFLDKDGTLLENVPYNVNPALMRFAPGVATGLRRLARLGPPLIVVSNQPGVALDMFGEAALEPVRQRLVRMFESVGACLSGFYYCIHHPQARHPELAIACDCRKPQAGMLLRAAAENRIDLQRSWLVGDILDDIEAGQRAGCETILVNNGNETEWLPGALRTPHHVVENFDQAALIIFENSAMASPPLLPPETRQTDLRVDVPGATR